MVPPKMLTICKYSLEFSKMIKSFLISNICACVCQQVCMRVLNLSYLVYQYHNLTSLANVYGLPLVFFFLIYTTDIINSNHVVTIKKNHVNHLNWLLEETYD